MSDETIAGYRVLRRMGSGTRCDVYLGAGHDGRTVALKVFRRGAVTSAVDAEVEIAGTVAGVALPRLLDVASVPDGRICLVLDPLTGPTLAQRLASGLSLGELVTVLGPLVAAVAALHDAGWCLGALSPASVRFSAAGRPVITSLAHAESLSRQAGTTTATAQRRRDYEVIAGFMRQVGGDDEALDRLASWLRERAAQRPLPAVLPELEHRIFGLAPAEPVRVEVPAAVVPLRLDDPAPLRGRALAEVGAQATEPAAAPDRFRRLLARPGSAVRAFASGERRRRFAPIIIGGAVAAVLVAAALTLLPAAERASSRTPRPASGAPTADPVASSAPSRSQEATGPSPESRALIAGEDPVAAAQALLQARAACVRTGEPACLLQVDELGSPLADADASAVEAAAVPVELDPGATLALASRSGDAAVIAMTVGDMQPASLLVVRGEAGWRLRDVFPAEG
ncbi:hypothetical protein WDJ51_00700 [Rathayibacter sp. YIM 133350]|uniref:hypothetical protein n=1 Tax=Rathayibacter sp. YIM 133350 TaxID=3131992 RepID=UPI00307F721E